MASWDDEDYEPTVDTNIPKAVKASWEDEDEEEEEEKESVPAPAPMSKAKSKKKEKEERLNAKGRSQEEEPPDSSLTGKELEERQRAREAGLLGDLLGNGTAGGSGLGLAFDTTSPEWLGDDKKREAVAVALKGLLPSQAALKGKEADQVKFLEVLTERLCLGLSSSEVRKLSNKTKALADALKKANDEKDKKGGKNLPKLSAGKARGNLDDYDDFGGGGGGGGGGAAAFDEDDFM